MITIQLTDTLHTLLWVFANNSVTSEKKNKQKKNSSNSVTYIKASHCTTGLSFSYSQDVSPALLLFLFMVHFFCPFGLYIRLYDRLVLIRVLQKQWKPDALCIVTSCCTRVKHYVSSALLQASSTWWRQENI